MSCAKIDPALHQGHKPPWIKVRLPSNPVFFSTKALISDLRLHTVCESAQCPNRWECWSQGTATFMIAGDRCTRACGFCAVTTAKPFSLQALRRAKALSAGVVTKSGVMLGLGEKETELFQTMDDLREAGCEVLTMGQYLRPTPKHLPVVEYITPEQFNYYGDIARRKGFLHVASGPLVRSSYHAADFHPVIPR